MRWVFLLPFFLVSSFCFSQAMLSGYITDADGRALPGVNIDLAQLQKTVVTDDDGYFYFAGLPAGRYSFQASHAGYKQSQFQAKVPYHLPVKIVLAAQDGRLNEVVLSSRKSMHNKPVSVSKINADPTDIPQSSTVIYKALIAAQQTQRLGDAIKNVNGVYVGGMRAGVQETFYARGYNFSSGNLFKNGSRINTGAFPEMSSLERVEVLKGSAAILYGNVAPGGIINMVTKQPKFGFGGEISLRAGYYGLLQPAADLYGPLSKKLAFRVNGTIEHANSFRQVVSGKKYYVNPSLLYKLNNKTEILLQGDHLSNRFTPDFGIGSLADTMLAPLPRNRFLGAAWQYNDVKQSTASANVKHTFSAKWKLNGNLSYQSFDRDYYAIERIQAKADGSWHRPLGRINTNEQYLSSTIDLTGLITTGVVSHRVLFGVDADHYLTTGKTFDMNGKIYDTMNILAPAVPTQRTDIPLAKVLTETRSPVYRTGFYLQDLMHVSEKIKLLAGIRYSVQHNKAVETTFTGKDSTGFGKADVKSALSPRLGLVYKPLKNISLFTSYANSFTMNTATDVHGELLDPSVIDQFEIGAKNELFNGRLTANLTLYKIINNNLAQTAQYLADGITPNNNSNFKELTGQTVSNGLEIDLQAQPLAGLNLVAGYSYNDMRYTKTPEGKGNYIKGDRLVNTPQHTANASAFYALPSEKLKGQKVGATFSYYGKRFAGWNNTQQQAQSYNRTIALKGFSTVDMHAAYTRKKLTLQVKVGNIANTLNYLAYENYSINPIAPRTLVTTARFSF